MDRLEMFRQNIHLLIGILAFLVLGGVLLVASITMIRAWLFRRSQQEAERAFQLTRFEKDGRAKPPQSLGVCSQCGKVADDVRQLSDGRKLCGPCYKTPDPSDASRVK